MTFTQGSEGDPTNHVAIIWEKPAHIVGSPQMASLVMGAWAFLLSQLCGIGLMTKIVFYRCFVWPPINVYIHITQPGPAPTHRFFWRNGWKGGWCSWGKWKDVAVRVCTIHNARGGGGDNVNCTLVYQAVLPVLHYLYHCIVYVPQCALCTLLHQATMCTEQ